MSAFRDLDDFLVVQPKVLPVRGKEYSFPGSVSGQTGLMLTRMMSVADSVRRAGGGAGDIAQATLDQEVLSDEEELDLYKELLGDAHEEMVRDGLSSAHVQHVFITLVVWHVVGEEAAVKMWDSAGNPPAPNRAARRGASKATAKSTRSRASTGGTTPRKRAAASGGRRS